MKPGQSVFHPDFGVGHVVRLIGDTVYVDFGDCIRRIKFAYLDLVPTIHDPKIAVTLRDAAWRKRTPAWVM